MVRSRLLLLSLLILGLACSGPSVLPTRTEEGFHLTDLKGAPVALWPIGTVDLDDSLTATVTREFRSPAAFSDQFTGLLGRSVLASAGPHSLGPADLAQAFRTPALKPLLEPLCKRNVPSQDCGLALTGEALGTFIQALKAQPVLRDIRYAILPHHLDIARGWSSQKAPSGPGNATSASTVARLRIVVIDLQQARIVWEGKVLADEESTFMKVKALHDAETKVAGAFGDAMQGRMDRL